GRTWSGWRRPGSRWRPRPDSVPRCAPGRRCARSPISTAGGGCRRARPSPPPPGEHGGPPVPATAPRAHSPPERPRRTPGGARASWSWSRPTTRSSAGPPTRAPGFRRCRTSRARPPGYGAWWSTGTRGRTPRERPADAVGWRRRRGRAAGGLVPPCGPVVGLTAGDRTSRRRPVSSAPTTAGPHGRSPRVRRGPGVLPHPGAVGRPVRRRLRRVGPRRGRGVVRGGLRRRGGGRCGRVVVGLGVDPILVAVGRIPVGPARLRSGRRTAAPAGLARGDTAARVRRRRGRRGPRGRRAAPLPARPPRPRRGGAARGAGRDGRPGRRRRHRARGGAGRRRRGRPRRRGGGPGERPAPRTGLQRAAPRGPRQPPVGDRGPRGLDRRGGTRPPRSGAVA